MLSIEENQNNPLHGVSAEAMVQMTEVGRRRTVLRGREKGKNL